jgi:hypothetical protein
VELTPPKEGQASASTRRAAQQALKRSQSRRKPSTRRATATLAALRREGRSAASKTALSRQARSAARKRGTARAKK